MRVEFRLRIAAAVCRRCRIVVLAAGAVIGTAVLIASAGCALLVLIHGLFLFYYGFGLFYGLLGLFCRNRCGSLGRFGFCFHRRCFGLFFRSVCLRFGLAAPHGRLFFGRSGHAVPRVAAHHRDLPAVQLLDARQIFLLLRGAETDGGAVGTGAGRAADAVYIGFRHLGQVVVEHMRQLADVNAAGCDVGRHQHLGLSGLESLQSGDAGTLALVAMDGRSRDALLGQVAGDLIRAVLGAAEHQRVLHRRVQVFDEPRQQEFFVALLDKIQALIDPIHRTGHRIHLDECRVVQDAGSQLLDLLRHGRAEHQVLPLGRELGDDPLHVVDKAHIQHPVGLVQHKDLNVFQRNEPLPDQIVQAARAGDQNVHAPPDGLDLRGLPHTAEDDGAAELEVLAVSVKALADLERKLPGRGQDQGTDGSLLPGRLGGQPIQHRQRKRRRLAGARLGAAHQIPPFQHGRDGRCLNGRGGFIARLRNSTQKGGGQIQFVKSHGSPIIL